jgi:hypothetical protein
MERESFQAHADKIGQGINRHFSICETTNHHEVIQH